MPDIALWIGGFFLLGLYVLAFVVYHFVIIGQNVPGHYFQALVYQLGYMSKEDFDITYPDDTHREECPDGGKLFQVYNCTILGTPLNFEWTLCGRWYFARCADLAAPAWALNRPEVAGVHLKVAVDPCGSLPKAEDVRAYIERAEAEGKDTRFQRNTLKIIELCPGRNLPVVLRYFDEQGQIVARIDIPAR